MEEEHFTGTTTVIVKDGEIVWIRSYGFADIENNIPVSDSTQFLLASMSKLFTGTATMQLKESGMLDLEWVTLTNISLGPYSICSKHDTDDHSSADSAYILNKRQLGCHGKLLWVSEPTMSLGLHARLLYTNRRKLRRQSKFY